MMIRFLHPSTKCLALSKASATARTFPSMGEYRDSVGCVNRLPTIMTFQSDWQQKALVLLHEQCFCNNQKHMPLLDQSVAKHIGFFSRKYGYHSQFFL